MNANRTINLAPWLALIEAKIGFVLPTTQHGWLMNAIGSTSAKYQMSAEVFFEFVQSDKEAWQTLLDAILITETRFFRHKPSVSFVAQAYQEYAEHTQKDFLVLSVGCSTGHETWSLAMALQHSVQHPRYKLLGLDGNRQALATAKQAHYSLKELDILPDEYYFLVRTEIQQGYFEPITPLRERVDFAWCNLFDDTLEQVLHRKNMSKANVIVCQNVLIYFRRVDQQSILARFVNRLHIGGYLILAGGEGLFWQHDEMQRLPHPSVNVWQKVKK